MSKTQLRTLDRNEQGLVAILVTMLIMIMLSLIVMGFAQLTRREQRQSLDRQLSTQAFYAAETGVNDTVRALANNPALSGNDYVTDCQSFISQLPAGSNSLPAANSSYTCLLVDPTPLNLEYKSIEQNTSEVLPIHRKDNNTINSISISWEDAERGPTPASCTYPAFRTLPQSWGTCPTGILRVEFVPFTGAVSRDGLIDNRFIAYMQPNFSGGVSGVAFVNGSGANQGVISDVRCTSNTGNDCVINLSGITVSNGYLRLTSYYRDATVMVCSPDCISPVELTGAQAQIDVTGRAADVSRRIQVRTPITSFGSSPEFAVQSFDTFCKRIAVAPPNSASVIAPPGGFAGSESSICNPN